MAVASEFFADARARMVDSQIRPNKVTDTRILHAMRTLPREQFLPLTLAPLAYADEERPVTSTNFANKRTYKSFNRYDFLKEDAAGEWYWEDSFLFSVDSASPLAANRGGFFGCKVFSKTNNYLKQHGIEPIDWQLDA